MLLKQTKIVASISDRRCDVDFIKQLFEAGMNVVRMNSAHLQEEGFQKIIDNVRAVSNKIAITCCVQPYCDFDGYKRSGSSYDG